MTQTNRFVVAETFGVKAPRGLTVEGFTDPMHPQIPVRKPYVFREQLRDVLAFLADPAGDGLLLTGPTGAGKTSLVLQVAARLNWPVQEVTCHGRMELSDLIGQFVLIQGETRFVHGPLAVAARDGHLLVLNEMDVMDAAELAGLNDIVEGAPLVIAANGGEVIRPHPKFRVIATGNSAGAGDTSGLYQGVLRQNLAFLDRFRVVQVSYPDAMTEQGLIKTLVPSLRAHRIAPNSAVHLLVDLSGSMHATVHRADGSPTTRASSALESALALALALDGIPGVTVATTAFPGRAGTADRVTRMVRHGQCPRACAGAFIQTARGGTPMAQALWYAAADLLACREERRMLMVLTDGEPDDTPEALRLLGLCRQAGIEGVGVGIGVDVRHLFPIAIEVTEAKDLKGALFGVAEWLLLGAAA